MRKFLIAGLVLVFVLGASGLALAVNNVDIDQTSGYGAVNPNTGHFADAEVRQGGYDQDVDIDQIAGDYNLVFVAQDGHGATYDNKIKVDQNAGTWNVAYVVQKYGKHNKVDFDQDAFTDNYARINQTDGGMHNILAGAFSDGSIDLGSPATQFSSTSYNFLDTFQGTVGNQIGLNQNAVGYNRAVIHQYGVNNSLGVYQHNTSGYNSVTSNQFGNMWAKVTQSTYSGAGIITVDQG